MKALGLALVILFTFEARASLYTEPQGGAPNESPAIAREIGFDQNLGASVPGELSFYDEKGKPVRLGAYFGARPVILALVYYGCPNLCTLVLNGLFKGLEELPFAAGTDYETVLVSIDPKETPALAAAKKKSYLTKFHRGGIHFLTGHEPEIKKLAASVGFRYVYDPRSGQFGHPAGLTILTPEGKVSRYLFGIEYAGRDLKLALVEASKSRIGAVLDKFLLYCFHYDPVQGAYSVAILNVLRAAAAAAALALFLGIGLALRTEAAK